MSHDPLGSQETLSSFSLICQIDRVYGPQLPHLRMAGFLVARCGDPSPFLQAKRDLELMLAGIQSPPSPDDCSQEAYLKETSSICRKVAAARQRYETQLTLHPHAGEFLWLLDEAIAGRRWWRRALRRAGLVCRGGAVRLLRRLHAVPAAALEPYFEYRRYESIVHAGLWAGCAAYQEGKDVPAIIQCATLAMRQVWFDNIQWQNGMLMYVPIPEVQAVGSLAFAGWVDSQLSLKHNRRLARVLNAELAMMGEYSKSRRDKLREHLPVNTFRAWHTEKEKTLAKLKTRIASLVEHDLSEQHSQAFEPDEPLQAVVQPRDNPTYEEVARKLEEEDLYKASFRQANLTPYEETVARLQLQDYSDQEIADKLGKKLNAIKQVWLSTRKKLKQVMPS